MKIEIKPIKKYIGATVHVDRAELTHPQVIAAVLDALNDRGVLVFPRINLTDAEQVAFTEALGNRVNFNATNKLLDERTIQADGIYKVTLDPKLNSHPEYVLGTFFWHMDGMPVDHIPPPKATMLSARKLSPKGGQTQFASTTSAYENLPAGEKADVDNLRVIHSVYAAVRPAIESDEEDARYRKISVQRERPLVWRQGSGRKGLIIGYTADYVVGMPLPEGRALLARLMEWAAQPDFQYSHEWEEGDLVIWDNSGVLHRAIPYARDSGRLMHRTSLAGVEEVD